MNNSASSLETSFLVSIIIPVYNSGRYIQETIRTCLNQTYASIEILVINDGSTDDSEDKILAFNDKRIKYYRIDNSGACAARNFGIQKASGCLFQFLDADDTIDNNKILNQIEKYKIYGDEYIYSAVMGTIIGDVKTKDEGYELYKRDFEPKQYFDILLNQFSKYLTTGIWLVPAKIVHLVGGWDTQIMLNQDGEYFMRAILHSRGIIYCDYSYFYYRRDVLNSISKKRNEKAIYESWLYSYLSYVDNFKKCFDMETANYLGWKALSVYYCCSYPNYPDLLVKCKNRIKALGYSTPHSHGGELFKKAARILGTIPALRLIQLKNKLFT